MRPEPILVFRNTKGVDMCNFILMYPCVPRVGDLVADTKKKPYKVTQVMWFSYHSSLYHRVNTEIQITVEKIK